MVAGPASWEMANRAIGTLAPSGILLEEVAKVETDCPWVLQKLPCLSADTACRPHPNEASPISLGVLDHFASRPARRHMARAFPL